MVVYTLRSWMSDKSFGYETTQVFRQNILEELGIENKLLIGTPYSMPFFKEQYQALGYGANNVIILPHLYSDINTNIRSYTVSDFENDLLSKNIKWIDKQIINQTSIMYTTDSGYIDINLTIDGYIIVIINRTLSLVNESTTSVFEKPFFKRCNDGSFEYYNCSGEVALKGAIKEKVCYYYKNGKELIMEDLFIDYFKNNISPDEDIILNDQFRSKRLKTYCSENGIAYRFIMHYNHYFTSDYIPEYDPTLLDDEIFVASKYIIPRLKEDGVKAEFLPPVAVPISKKNPIGLESNKIILVGNCIKVKRIHMAVEAMKRFPNLELHIYGGRHENIKQFKEEHDVPENVTFKGFVPSVSIPRSEYLAYLSCSESEMFANAMVECLGEGLIPVLSRVDYGHNQVLEELGFYETFGFDTVEELVLALEKLLSLSLEERIKLSNQVLDYADNTFSRNIAKKEYKYVLDSLKIK